MLERINPISFSVSALTLSNVTGWPQGGSNQISISTIMNQFIRELLSPCKQILNYRLPKKFLSLCHSLSRQPARREVLCFQQDLQCE
jgi:hypothetical protein